MKKRIFALVSIMLMMACTGMTARKEVLLPAMSMAWQSSIAEEVTRGGADPAPMTKALKARDIDAVLAMDWAELRKAAGMGIDKSLELGLVGPNGKDIFLIQLSAFDRAMRKLAGKTVTSLGRLPWRHSDVLVYRTR